MFYGSHRRNATRFRTLAEARNQAEASASCPVNVVVLPPVDGDKNNDNYVENEAVNDVNDTDFETAGEVELKEEDSEDEEDDGDGEETPAQPKAKSSAANSQLGRKSLTTTNPSLPVIL